MTPKEKAQELLWKYLLENCNTAKHCALIEVNEILEATKHEYQIQYESGEWSREIGYKYSEYWQEVKQELEKL